MKSKKLSRLLKIQAVVFAVIIAAGACSVGAFAYNCSRVRSDVLRMHVIANSDSDEDQALKLKVRDAVLERGAELFDGTVTADEAKAKIEPQKAELEAAAREVIEREGYDYPAVSLSVSVSEQTETMLKVYIEGVRDADAMLGRLVDYFSATDEPEK